MSTFPKRQDTSKVKRFRKYFYFLIVASAKLMEHATITNIVHNFTKKTVGCVLACKAVSVFLDSVTNLSAVITQQLRNSTEIPRQ